MTLDEMNRGSVADAEPVESYSVAWWESRSAEELRHLVNRGFAGGQLFKAANAEIERRAREEIRRLRALADAEASERERRRKIIWGVIASILALAAIAELWLTR